MNQVTIIEQPYGQANKACPIAAKALLSSASIDVNDSVVSLKV